MTGQPPSSDIELRLFDQVCEAIDAKTDEQKTLLKTSIRNDLASEWTSLVASMELNGPLSLLSEDEMKYVNKKYSIEGSQMSTEGHDQMSIFSQPVPMSGQKIIDHEPAKVAVHDLHQYNNNLEKLVAKYKDYARRSIATMQRSTELNEQSTIEQKLNALSLRKDNLRKEIRALEDKISNRVNRLEDITQPNETAYTDGESYDNNIKSNTEKYVYENEFPSYDHILEKLNALQEELNYDAVDDTMLHTARRHASQIVLSQATRCRASLDAVFLQASHRYSENYKPDHSRATDDERNAVYSEIQSLWDEMVPLAHMVVEKEHLKPILNKIEMCSDRQTTKDATVAVYTSAMLRFMNERLRILLDRIKSLVYHLRILSSAVTYMNNGRPQSEPVGMMGTAKSLAESDKKTNGQTLLKTIQRQMELYGPIPTESENERLNQRMQVDKIDRYLLSRQRKGDDLARNMHEYFERTVKAELTDTELAGHLLLDSLVADSVAGYQSGGNVYEDQQVEDSVATVKSQADEIKTIIGELLDDGTGIPSSAPDFISYVYSKATKQPTKKGHDGQERCAKLETFIHKWGESAGITN